MVTLLLLLLQIADKSMAEQSKILDTIKSKLIQANTDTHFMLMVEMLLQKMLLNYLIS